MEAPTSSTRPTNVVVGTEGGTVTFGAALYTGQGSVAAGRGYRDAIDLAVAAEESGFDMFWVSEHHGWDDGYLPSPLVVLAAVAARTATIELGVGVALAPLHHPVRLAEDVAVLDQLANGRLILGLGIGYVDSEYEMFGVDRRRRAERLESAIAALRDGAPGRLDETRAPSRARRVVPAQARPGGVPLWLGGYAAAAVERAGRLADGHLVGRGSAEIIARSGTQLAAARSPDDTSFTRAVNVAVVLDAPGAHPGSARAAFAAQQIAYERRQRQQDVYAGQVGDPVGDGTLTEGSIDAYVQVSGDVGKVIDGLSTVVDQLRPWSRRHIAIRLLFPGEPTEVQVERLRLFGTAVLPELRAASATPLSDHVD